MSGTSPVVRERRAAKLSVAASAGRSAIWDRNRVHTASSNRADSRGALRSSSGHRQSNDLGDPQRLARRDLNRGAGPIERFDIGWLEPSRPGSSWRSTQIRSCRFAARRSAANACSIISTRAVSVLSTVRRGTSIRCAAKAGIRSSVSRSLRTKTNPVKAGAGRNSTRTSSPLQ